MGLKEGTGYDVMGKNDLEEWVGVPVDFDSQYLKVLEGEIIFEKEDGEQKSFFIQDRHSIKIKLSTMNERDGKLGGIAIYGPQNDLSVFKYTITKR